tara:strand:- start:306 stop:530 length:225 start_codon:yes stop_codon:yes gene_type:complete
LQEKETAWKHRGDEAVALGGPPSLFYFGTCLYRRGIRLSIGRRLIDERYLCSGVRMGVIAVLESRGLYGFSAPE